MYAGSRPWFGADYLALRVSQGYDARYQHEQGAPYDLTRRKHKAYDIAGSSTAFSFLWLGQAVSQLGDAVIEVTLPVRVGLLTGSPSQVAGVAATATLPALLAGPFAGVLADRWDPRKTMIACAVADAAGERAGRLCGLRGASVVVGAARRRRVDGP
jgi:hypothetical protein